MRTYKFAEKTKNGTKTVELKETELTKKHKELILGNLINEFNKAPREVQMQFLQLVVSNTKTEESKIIKLKPHIIKP